MTPSVFGLSRPSREKKEEKDEGEEEEVEVGEGRNLISLLLPS